MFDTMLRSFVLDNDLIQTYRYNKLILDCRIFIISETRCYIIKLCKQTLSFIRQK